MTAIDEFIIMVIIIIIIFTYFNNIDYTFINNTRHVLYANGACKA